MGIFDKIRKKNEVIDYTEQYKYSVRKRPTTSTTTSTSSITPQTKQPTNENLGFLSDFSQASQSPSATGEIQYPDQLDLEPKEKLKQRLMNMTTQLEDLSTQLYRMQQRLELIEQKLKSRQEYLG